MTIEFKGLPIIDKGQVYRLTRTDLTVVIRNYTSSGCFDCIVLDAPEGSAYPVGGYDICVFERELRTEAVRVDMSGLL